MQCSDTGTGTLDLPFCTIQAAANAVRPGQTVLVDPPTPEQPATDSYSPTLDGFSIFASGTPAEPITYTTGSPNVTLAGQVSVTASDVTLDGFTVSLPDGTPVQVDDSTDVTLSHLTVDAASGPAIDVQDVNRNVTITRNRLTGQGGVAVDTGNADTIITDNVINLVPNTLFAAIRTTEATGTVITNNTVRLAQGCATGVDVIGAAHTTVENNVIEAGCASDSNAHAIGVADIDTTAATDTALIDFNVVHSPLGGNDHLYFWAGESFMLATAFNAETGQAAHDSNIDPVPAADGSTRSPAAIDSADPTAPDVPDTDIDGHTRVDDPLVANNPGIVDRGAVEAEDPLAVSLQVSPTTVAAGTAVTATPRLANGWAPVTGITVDFGDGSAPVPSGQVARHTYTAAGTYEVTATATDGFGTASAPSAPVRVTVTPPPPPTVVVKTSAVDGQGVSLDVSGSTDVLPITGFQVDYGDGTPVTPALQHNYAKVGTYSIAVTLTDSAGTQATATTTFTTAGDRFTAIGPARLLDTRHGTGTGGTIAKVAANGTLKLKVAGVAGIPADVRAVVLNVTVTAPATGGDVIVYPDGISRPTVSTVNFVKNQTVPNLTVVPVGADGMVDLSVVGGPVDLVADATGYFDPRTGANGYTTITSSRLLDTRNGTGTGGKVGPVAANGTLHLPVAGVAGIPATGVTAVAMNVTVTAPTQGGFITAHPDGATRPNTSSVNFDPGLTVANLVIVPVGAAGKVALFNSSPGTTQLVADVVGYFTSAGGNTYVPVTPTRAFDTRNTGAIPPRSGEFERITSVPETQGGVVLNVTVAGPTEGGFVLVGPDPLPAGLSSRASTVNWTNAGEIRANLAIPSSPAGSVTVFNGSDGTTNVIGDVFGYFEPGTPQS
ncbi:MAG TPA: PKD domain-containing protein [Pseudonocardiaceae bacterium]|nr:PKD domain-containing protein [Pseudonocardiaceae bacterium]